MSNFIAQERNGQIMEWAANAKELARLKALEMKQRNELFGLVFLTPKKGTNNFKLGGDWLLKAVTGTETSLEVTSFELLREKLIADAPEVVAAVIKYKPALDMKAYNALSDAERAQFDDCVVTKPKAITLELVPPKG